MSTEHEHPLDPDAVAIARKATLPDAKATRLSEMLKVLSDPTRVRVVFALAAVPRLCVGDIGAALGTSMDQSSYALKQLRAAGLVQAEREGRAIYYSLGEGFPRQLVDHCLLELIEISEGTTK